MVNQAIPEEFNPNSGLGKNIKISFRYDNKLVPTKPK